jgi:hypothetical protein
VRVAERITFSKLLQFLRLAEVGPAPHGKQAVDVKASNPLVALYRDGTFVILDGEILPDGARAISQERMHVVQ